MLNKHILVVEDEDVTRFSLCALFKAEGYQVYEAVDEVSMQECLAKSSIDLVIMDINLPGKNGLVLAKELISKSGLGVIFLTGRDNDVDKLSGLELGADDYITKPFNPRELVARARNTINRLTPVKTESAETIIAFDGWLLNADSRVLTSPSGQEIAIARGEFRVLRLLIEQQGKIVTRQQLIKEMTGRDLRDNDRTVDVTVRRLRKHFENENDSNFIQTVHGEGYRFIGSLA